MYKLYARKNTGSAAVEALLEVLGAPYELVDVVKTKDNKAPDWFFKLNPRGEVPVLELPDGSIMTESAAIMIYLADAHPEAGLAPANGTQARAQYLRWMIYMAASPYNSDLRMYYSDRYSTDKSHADGIKAQAIIALAHDLDIFANEMGDGPYILGDKLSAADIYASMLLTWSNDTAALFERQPKLKRLFDKISENPTILQVWKRNGVI